MPRKAHPALQAPLPAGAVAECAAQGAGKDVHQPEQAGDDPGPLQPRIEVILEVQGGDVVDREFDPEARAVDHEQRPHPPVTRRQQE